MPIRGSGTERRVFDERRGDARQSSYRREELPVHHVLFGRMAFRLRTTIGVDEETVRRYVRYQEKEEKREEEAQCRFRLSERCRLFGRHRLCRW